MHLAEPRIEPEIVFKLAVAPAPGMGEGALLESIDWVAHGFENDAALKKANDLLAAAGTIIVVETIAATRGKMQAGFRVLEHLTLHSIRHPVDETISSQKLPGNERSRPQPH